MVSVYVGRCERDGVDEVTRHVRAALDALDVAPPGGDVLLQPACPWSHPRYAPDACTEPATVEGVARAFDGAPLVLGIQSLPGFPTRYTAPRAGYDEMSRRIGARQVRFDETAFRRSPDATLGGAGTQAGEDATETTLSVSAAWRDAGFRISIPRLAGSTALPFAGATRHLYDLVPQATQTAEHHRIEEAVGVLARVAPPDLIVLDAIRATHEGGELSGLPVELGIVVIGTDPIAVDLVGAAAYGVPDTELAFLRGAATDGDAPRSASEVDVIGDLTLGDVQALATRVHRMDPNPEAFPRPAKIRVARSPRTRLSGPSGTLTEVFAILRRAGIALDGARETTLVLGPAEAIPDGTTDYSTIVFLGDTARGDYKGYSRVVRLQGRNLTVSQVLQDVPFAMTVGNVRSELGWQFLAAGWAAGLARAFGSVGRVGAGRSVPPAAKGGGEGIREN
jgi:uncharacterized protein (DUF362 family)